jgi:hypothetical protein
MEDSVEFYHFFIFLHYFHRKGVKRDGDIVQMIERLPPRIVGGGFFFPVSVLGFFADPPAFGYLVREPYKEDDKTCKKGHFHI